MMEWPHSCSFAPFVVALLWSLRLELGGDLGDVLALVAGDGEFVFSRLALALGAGDRGGAVGGAAGDLGHVGEVGAGVGDADDEHALVEEERVGGDDRGFLAAVLGGGGGERAADLADEGAGGPELAGGVEEGLHLGDTEAEAG